MNHLVLLFTNIKFGAVPNVGENLYDYVSTQAQAIALVAIMGTGLWWLFTRKMSALIATVVTIIVAVTFVFAPTIIKNLGLDIFNQFLGS